MPVYLGTLFRHACRWLLLVLGWWLISYQVRAQTFDLARSVGKGTGLPDRSSVNDLAVDGAGNSYLTGSFTGTVQFGPTTLTAPSVSGERAAFVTKMDPQGNFLWAVQSTPGAEGYGIVVDATGASYLTGTFAQARFGSFTLPNAGTASGSRDIFVACLDPAGHWLWAVGAGGSGQDVPSDLALDPAGNLYLTGAYTNEATFGQTVLPNPAGARTNLFVARLTTQGTWRWAVSGGGTLDDMAACVVRDRQGHLYIAGAVASARSVFGPLTLPGPTAYLAQLDEAGAYQWIVPCGNERTGFTGVGSIGGVSGIGANTRSLDLTIDAAGNPYLAGAFTGPSVRFGSLVLSNATPSTTDGFVTRFDATGTFRWAVLVGGPGNEACSRLTTDARGNLYVTGTYGSPSVSFGTTVLRSPNPNNHVYLASLDARGTWRWALAAPTASLGINGNNASNGLALGPGDSPILGGVFDSSISFGGSLSLQSVIDQGFVARARAAPTVVITGDTLLCNGGQLVLTATTRGTGTAQAYAWSTGATTPTITVTQPGTYRVRVTFENGALQTDEYRVLALLPTVRIAGGDVQLCPGGSVQLRAIAPGAKTLRWNTGASTALLQATQPGTYTVTAEYGAGCTATAQVLVGANMVAIQGRQQLCPGQSTTLTATGAGSTVTGYRWNTGATTPTLRVAAAGSYAVTATFADGCVVTTTHLLGPPRAQIASVSGDTLLCPGTVLTLSARNPDALSYRWNTGATTPTIEVAAPDTYAVALTYEGGCISRDSLRVLLVPVVTAFTLGPDTTLCLEVPLVLRVPALAGPGVQRRWSDGSTGSTLRVTAAGAYSLQLITPCETHVATRRVAYTSCLFIPNIITPNGDGRNDAFVLTGLPPGPWALALYNRWGRQVYTTAAYQQDWGAEATAGIYYYLLSQGASQYKGFLEVVK